MVALTVKEIYLYRKVFNQPVDAVREVNAEIPIERAVAGLKDGSVSLTYWYANEAQRTGVSPEQVLRAHVDAKGKIIVVERRKVTPSFIRRRLDGVRHRTRFKSIQYAVEFYEARKDALPLNEMVAHLREAVGRNNLHGYGAEWELVCAQKRLEKLSDADVEALIFAEDV